MPISALCRSSAVTTREAASAGGSTRFIFSRQTSAGTSCVSATSNISASPEMPTDSAEAKDIITCGL